MATALGHTLGAYAALVSLEPKLATDLRTNRMALGTAFAFGSLADADFVVAHFTTNPALQHHYFTHTIPFAVLVLLVSFLILKWTHQPRPWKTAILLGAAYGTHLLLDYFTEDGSAPFGIPLLWPFTRRHFLSPFIIFYSIHRGTLQDLFSVHNVVAILIEAAVMGPVALLAFLRARHKLR